MTGKRPIPLKDEPIASLDELQSLLTENITAINALNKTLGNRTDTQVINPEDIASAAKNAVRELLEQRQRKFEQEDEEAKARGALTPQECYARLSEDYADVLRKCMIVCDTYRHIEEIAKRQEIHSSRIEAKLDALTTKQDIQSVGMTKTMFPPRPKRFKDTFVYLFKDIPLYGLHWVCHSRYIRRFIWICLLCIWLITIAATCFIVHDNVMLRKKRQQDLLQREHIEYAPTYTE